MKRIIFLLMLLSGLTAQAQTRNVGYTVTDDIDVTGGAFGQAGTYTIGAVLTPDMLSAYEGCRVQGIRLASALPLGRTRMFIYDVSGTEMTTVVEQRQRIYEGWNTVSLNGDGYVIKGTESLFFGFDYVETDEMVAADEGALCGAGSDTDGAFYLYGNYSSGLGLYPITGIGCLCVQLVVDVSSLPQYDLDMTYLDTGFKYKQPGEDIEVLSAFTNVGRETVSQFQLGYRLDDQQPVYQTVTDTLLREGRTDYWQFDCPLADDIATGMHRLSIFVSQVEGQPMAARSKNDTVTAQFAVYRQSVPRTQSYLEVYTDQTSENSAMLNDVLALFSTDPQLCIANVHRPGTPLAVAEAAYLHDLYAYDWPTFTSNRSYFPGEPYVAYDMNDYLPNIPASMSAGIISQVVMQDYYTPAFASLSLQADYQADVRQLLVTTAGQLLPEAGAIYGDLALTLMLLEDSVQGAQMVYNARTQRVTNNPNYLHHHVLRGYLTAPTGDLVTTFGTDYEQSHTLTIPDEWNPAHLTLVALLTKHVDAVTDSNLRDVDVINACSLPLSSVMQRDGIATVRPDATAATYYTLDGKRVDRSSLRRGAYIERQNSGIVRKILVK